MLPGMLFVIWATHWVQGSLRQYLAAQRAGVPYESQPYYSLPCLPPFPYESVVKVAMSGGRRLLLGRRPRGARSAAPLTLLLAHRVDL